MGGKLTKIFIVSNLSAMLVACQQALETSRYETMAPITQDQAGVIVNSKDSAEIAAILAEHPQAKVREVNKKHGLYEVTNVSMEAIKEMGLQAEISKNVVYKTYNSPEFKPLNTNGEVDLSQCRRSFFAPKPKLTIKQNDQHIPMMPAFLKGSSIPLSGETSQNSSSTSGPLKMVWEVVAPDGSSNNGLVKVGSSLTLNVEDLGVYQVYLIVQDSQMACQATASYFIVTDNPGLKPVAEVDLLEPNAREFTHLKDVDAEAAWAKSKGEGITIAVIDTGVNYNHPALQQNILVNQEEIPGNQIDDDNNGYVDDHLGYDFVFNDGDAYDDGSHGTHVAGLAAGKGMGVAPNAKILPVKALSAISGDAATISAAIYFAVDRGADVINLSLGGYGAPHPELLKALNYAESKNIIVIAASGNGHPRTGLGVNIDRNQHSPGGLNLSNLVTVAAHADGKPLTKYSNYGQRTVDVVAPGGSRENKLLSAKMENPNGDLYEGMNGTSMASPVVAGIAALVKSSNNSLDYGDVKEILLNSGSNVMGLSRVTKSGKHISAADAVTQAQPTQLALLPSLFN